MKKISVSFIIVGLIMFFLISNGPLKAWGQQANGFESRPVNIWSDGTRLTGDLFYPKGLKAGDKLPALVLCHGWGGVRIRLNEYAPLFANAGYVVLTFDYRGWGDSDSRLVIKGKMPAPNENGEVTVRAQAIRELVDPRDQIEDIINCINFISGEPIADPERIGLWGTSYAGGHILRVAAHDSRVKCIVTQVGSFHNRWVNKPIAYKQAIDRARGEIDPVPQGVDKPANLKGTPHRSRMADHNPIDFVDRLKIPVLIIDVENDQFNKTKENGHLLYELVKDKVPAKYDLIPGITHFEIYSKGARQAVKLTIEWYDKHLKKK
jgi:dipeptidyl aminopeptidase/acylaminoacyl peptidase